MTIVRTIRPFVGFLGSQWRSHAPGNQFVLPDGVDWLEDGFVEVVALTLPQVASAALLLHLRADAGVTQSGGAVSNWADQSGNGHDFTQATGSAQPTLQIGPYIQFDGVDDFLSVPNTFADNLDSFSVFAVGKVISGTGQLIAALDGNIYGGWELNGVLPEAYLEDVDEAHFLDVTTNSGDLTGTWNLCELVLINRSTLALYVNGVAVTEAVTLNGPITDYHSDLPLSIARKLPDFGNVQVRAVLIYAPAPSDADRQAIEAWLQSQWGL